MKSLNISTRTKGFTLIEVLVVVGIFILLASLGLFMSLDTYRGTSVRSERDMVVVLLEKARSQSMNNINQATHGFCFDNAGKNYAVFEGLNYAVAVNKEFTPAGNITLAPDCSSGGVIFEQLSGSLVGSPVSLVLTQNSQSRTVSINSEGLIDW